MYVILLIFIFVNVANDIGKGIIFDTTCASLSLFGNCLCFIVLFKSEVRCLLSTGAPALRSLQDIWLIPVAFLILIFLPSFVC
jgi:hypothetical protein